MAPAADGDVFSGFYRSIHRHPRFGWVPPLTPETYDAPEAALVANISARVAGDNDWFLTPEARASQERWTTEHGKDAAFWEQGRATALRLESGRDGPKVACQTRPTRATPRHLGNIG